MHLAKNWSETTQAGGLYFVLSIWHNNKHSIWQLFIYVTEECASPDESLPGVATTGYNAVLTHCIIIFFQINQVSFIMVKNVPISCEEPLKRPTPSSCTILEDKLPSEERNDDLMCWTEENCIHAKQINEVPCYNTKQVVTENTDSHASTCLQQCKDLNEEFHVIKQGVDVSQGFKTNGMISDLENVKCNSESKAGDAEKAAKNVSGEVYEWLRNLKQCLVDQETGFIQYISNPSQENDTEGQESNEIVLIPATPPTVKCFFQHIVESQKSQQDLKSLTGNRMEDSTGDSDKVTDGSCLIGKGEIVSKNSLEKVSKLTNTEKQEQIDADHIKKGSKDGKETNLKFTKNDCCVVFKREDEDPVAVKAQTGESGRLIFDWESLWRDSERKIYKPAKTEKTTENGYQQVDENIKEDKVSDDLLGQLQNNADAVAKDEGGDVRRGTGKGGQTLEGGSKRNENAGNISNPRTEEKITKHNFRKVADMHTDTSLRKDCPENNPDIIIGETKCIRVESLQRERNQTAYRDGRTPLKGKSEREITDRYISSHIQRQKRTEKDFQEYDWRVETSTKDGQAHFLKDTTEVFHQNPPHIGMDGDDGNRKAARACFSPKQKTEGIHIYSGDQSTSQLEKGREPGEEKYTSDDNEIFFTTEKRGVDGVKKNLKESRGNQKYQTWQTNGILCTVFHLMKFFGLIIAVVNVPTISASVPSFCAERQTVALGKPGIVHCNFPRNFHAVYWLDDTTNDAIPVISCIQGVKGGPGFKSNTYQLSDNGSLIIPHTTVRHEKTYKVIVYLNPDSFETITIAVRVVASPERGRLSLHCRDCNYNNYLNVHGSETLACSFDAARPPVHLELEEMFVEGDTSAKLQELNITQNNDGTFKSLVSLPVTRDGNRMLSLFACRAKWSSSGWSNEKRILLDYTSKELFSNSMHNSVYLQISTPDKIPCGNANSISKIWKKNSSKGEYEVLAIQLQGLTQVITNFPGIWTSRDGSLLFSSPMVQHEGTYACVHSDGGQEGMKKIFIQIMIPPTPPYIQIEGCDDLTQSCRLREENTPRLTCGVNGIRPNVSFEWTTHDKSQIAFHNQTYHFEYRGYLLDVFSSVDFSVSKTVVCEKEIVIKCRLQGPLSKIMKNEETVYLKPQYCIAKEDDKEDNIEYTQIILFGLIVPVVMFFIVVVTVYCKMTICRSSERPIMPRDGDTETVLL